MTPSPVFWGFLFTILLTPNTLCEKADDEKRASLAYFKRSEDTEMSETTPKRASLAYYKRSNPLSRRATLSYFKRAYNLCECPDPYLFDSPSFDHPLAFGEWSSEQPYAEEDKRASLAYFKKRRTTK